MRSLLACAALSGALSLTACASDPNNPRETCAEQAFGAHYLDIENRPATPGARLELRPERVDGPFGEKPVEARCLSDWSVSPDGAASLSRNRRFLTISRDAQPGDTITISARIGDNISEGEVIVARAGAASLQGVWMRVETEDCPPLRETTAVRQLTIRDDSYGWQNQEGRQWGADYSFDPETMTVVFGTYVLPQPDSANLDGVAELSPDGQRLTLTGVDFGDPWERARPECAMVFERAAE